MTHHLSTHSQPQYRSLTQPRRKYPAGVRKVDRSILLAAVCASALVVASAASAKTLVFCSEGSPENFYPGVNTTGTSFDGNEPIYNRIVEFERGGTQVVPGLAEKWTISPDGLTYTFNLRKGVKWHATSKSFKPTRDFNADDVIAAVEGGQSVFQGDESEPLVFRRHGDAEIVEVRRE